MNQKIASELVDMAERVAANKTLLDYDGDDAEIADDLEAALSYFLGGSSEVNKTEIIFYEEETRKGESVQISVTVENQWRNLLVGLYITGENGDGPTYEDGMWSFDITDSVREVAKTIGQAAQKVLKKF